MLVNETVGVQSVMVDGVRFIPIADTLQLISEIKPLLVLPCPSGAWFRNPDGYWTSDFVYAAPVEIVFIEESFFAPAERIRLRTGRLSRGVWVERENGCWFKVPGVWS